MAGIWEAPAHECALTRGGKYDLYKGLSKDYPSISEINYLLEEKQTSLVFGVTNNVFKVYEELVNTEALSSSRVGIMDKGM